MESIKVAWVGLVIFALNFSAFSQEKKTETNVELGKVQDLNVEFDTVPDSVGAGGKSGTNLDDVKAGQEGRWLRIEAPFSTKKKFTPEVKFKFYIEGYEVVPATEGANTSEKYVVLTGEAVYRDVPGGKKQYAAVFLTPASVLRFAGLKSGGEQDWPTRKMNVRVEAFEGGSPVEGALDLQGEKEIGLSQRGGKKNPDWYTGAPPAGSKMETGKVLDGVLLPVSETPFWPKDYKRYPQPKKP
jgi:hypothetical protein